MEREPTDISQWNRPPFWPTCNKLKTVLLENKNSITFDIKVLY